MPIERLTHVGLCVSDLERSLRFYRDVLGCVEVGRMDLSGEAVDTLNEMQGVKVRAIYLERDGWRIELMEFAAPPPVDPKGPSPLNRLGLTHLAFRVKDLDAVCAQVEAAGGGLLRASQIEMPGPTRAMMVHDPDGQRLELIDAPGDPNAVLTGARDR